MEDQSVDHIKIYANIMTNSTDNLIFYIKTK